MCPVAEGAEVMSANANHAPADDNELEAAVDEAIAVCDGDPRAAVRALIVANSLLESEMADLKKAVSHAYTRGRFRSYAG